MHRSIQLIGVLVTGFGFLTSCECMNVACDVPQPAIEFQLVDGNTSEDLFINGTLDPNTLMIDESSGLNSWSYRISEDSTAFIIYVTADPGINSYSLSADPDARIDITVDVLIRKSGCCPSYRIKDVRADGYIVEYVEGIYIILI